MQLYFTAEVHKIVVEVANFFFSCKYNNVYIEYNIYTDRLGKKGDHCNWDIFPGGGVVF